MFSVVGALAIAIPVWKTTKIWYIEYRKMKYFLRGTDTEDSASQQKTHHHRGYRSRSILNLPFQS